MLLQFFYSFLVGIVLLDEANLQVKDKLLGRTSGSMAIVCIYVCQDFDQFRHLCPVSFILPVVVSLQE